jgi:transposase-like protein
MPENAIQDAIEAAGGVTALARALGVTHQAVYEWKRAGWCPPLRAVEIELQYGVPRRRLMNPRLLDIVDVPSASR